MANHDGRKKIFIGDNGAVEKPDIFSVVVIATSNILVVVLFYLGVRAYIG